MQKVIGSTPVGRTDNIQSFSFFMVSGKFHSPGAHTVQVSSELFHSQGSYHSLTSECLTLFQICRKTKGQKQINTTV